jgi:hypothetical protein
MRTRKLAVECLEARALLSATSTPDLAALGSIDRPRGQAVVPLTIAPGTFNDSASASGKVLFEVQVAADDGSAAVPARFAVLNAQGRIVGLGSTRGGVLSGLVDLSAGNYRVVVRDRGIGTGSIVVTARMVGDANGDHQVDATDLEAIQDDLGATQWGSRRFGAAPAYDAGFDANNDGRITGFDLATARSNLGASVPKVKLLVQLAPDALKSLGNANLYVAYIVTAANGTQEYLNKYGVLVLVKGTDDSVPINGVNYADYSVPLSDPLVTNGIDVDPNIAMGSTRIWISADKPIYFRVLTQNNDPNGPVTGFVQPSITNPSDVNYNTVFDFQEFSLSGDALNGNLTQVDMFGLPMTLQYASGSNTTTKVGIDQDRDAVLSGLNAALNASTLPADLVQAITAQGTLRALSVKDALSPYADKQAALNYFQPAIDQLWAKYPAGGALSLTLSTINATYNGQVTSDGMFTFTPVSGSLPAVKLAKPTSWNVFGSNGRLAPGNNELGALAAQVSAALNRGTSNLDSSQWEVPANFYPAAGPANFYARYWHTVSLGGLAYGFDYDDVGNQSTLINITNATQMTLTVHWTKP